MSNFPLQPISAFLQPTILDDTTPLTPATFVTASVVDQEIDALWAANNDTIDHDVTFTFGFGMTLDPAIGTVTIPAGAGFTAGIPAVDVLAAVMPVGGVLIVPKGCLLEDTLLVAINTGKNVTFVALGALV